MCLANVWGRAILGRRLIEFALLFSDDLGSNFPGYQNAEGIVKTPTLDRLATQEGVRLRSAYM